MTYMVTIFGWAGVVYSQGTLLLQDPFDVLYRRREPIHCTNGRFSVANLTESAIPGSGARSVLKQLQRTLS